MAILKQAFNMVTKIHSRAATLKRPGNLYVLSNARITPSNYFRFLQGPSATVIHGREFIIPIDSLTVVGVQTLSLGEPTDGTYKLSYSTNDTANIPFGSNAKQIQAALRLVAGVEDVEILPTDTAGVFKIRMYGIAEPLTLVVTPDVDFDGDAEISVELSEPVTLKRGDKIIDKLGHMAIDEIVEMVDIGGETMGYRVRAE